jgi:co-chaperonin GroES (HSP10)
MIACNNWVIIIRDELEEDVLYDPTRIKPHCGTIIGVGDLVESLALHAAVGQKCLWHPTAGQEIEFEGIVYLLLEGEKVIALP